MKRNDLIEIDIVLISVLISRFNIITFAGDVRTWMENEMASVNEENIDRASNYVNQISAFGSEDFLKLSKIPKNLLPSSTPD